QGLPHLGRHPSCGLGTVERKHQIVDATAEVGPHLTFAAAGGQDDPDRLANALFLGGQGDLSVVERNRKAPTCPEKISVHRVASPQPIITVPAATTVPAGRSDGSLQVPAMSPLRAAALPLIFTVGLPILIVPLLAGDF